MIAVNLVNLKLDLFARHILTNVDWEIHDDRCVGPIGANGAGKSSLLKLLAGEIAGSANRQGERLKPAGSMLDSSERWAIL